MEKIRNLFTRSTDDNAINMLYDELVQLHDSCVDNFYVLVNDYKNKLSDKILNDPSASIYQNNPSREHLSKSTNLTPIEDITPTSNEYRILSEILTLNDMIENIEHHIITHCNEFDALFSFFGKSSKKVNLLDRPLTTIIRGGGDDDSSEWQEFDISFDETSKVIITPGIRDLTLIAVLLVVYLFYDGMDWVIRFYNAMNIYYHLGDNYDSTGPVELLTSESKTTSEEIKPTDSIQKINERMFDKFHALIHLLNKQKYNNETIKTEFSCLQLFLLFKSIVLLHKHNGNSEFIDSSVLMSKSETECTLIHNGIEPAFTNALLCSKYAFNSRYDWFDLLMFNDYLAFYGNTVKTLSIFIFDHEKYNVLYAFGVLHAIRYANISLSNKLLEYCDYVRSEDVDIDLLVDYNRAMLFTVKDPNVPEKLNYYVLEAQDRVLYVASSAATTEQTEASRDINSQVMNDNRNTIDSFIVYSILTPSINNVDYITYDIDDLKQTLEQYKRGTRRPDRKITPSSVNIDESVMQIMNRTINRQTLILKIIVFVSIVALIAFIVYSSKNAESLTAHQHLNMYDKSLL